MPVGKTFYRNADALSSLAYYFSSQNVIIENVHLFNTMLNGFNSGKSKMLNHIFLRIAEDDFCWKGISYKDSK